MAAVTGTSGNDFIHAAGDGLFPPTGYNEISTATDGGDIIRSGGGGSDIIFAGGGDDSIVFGSDLDANDVINGGAGIDTLFINKPANVVFSANSLSSVEYISTSTSASVSLTMNGANVADVLKLHIDASSIAIGNSFFFDGSGVSDGTFSIKGGKGDDSLNGGSGADHLIGNTGHDQLNGGGDDDILRGGNGNDTLNGNAGNDSLIGGSGVDGLNGGNGDDDLNGRGGKDALNGGGGHDLLVGGAGDDQLTGGHGVDTFFFAGSFGHDTITDFSARNLEQIDLSGVTGITGFHNLVTHHLNPGPVADSVVIDDGSGHTIVLLGFTMGDFGAGQPISGADFIFS